MWQTVLSVVVLCGCGHTPQTTNSPTQPTGAVNLSFMVGCWDGANASYLLAEHYRMENGRMVGESVLTSQYPPGSRMLERTTINIDPPVTMTSTINGETLASFTVADSSEDQVQFENLNNDFPIRITYRRIGPNLVARIEGQDPAEDALQWTLEPADCRLMVEFIEMVRDEVEERSETNALSE